MANQGEAEQVTARSDGHGRDLRESGHVPLAPTLNVPRIVASGTLRASADPSWCDALPSPALPGDAQGRIVLPASRRVTQRPPHEPRDSHEDDDDDEDGIIGLPVDVLRIESDLAQDADEEILGLPSLLPGADEDDSEIVGRPTESTFAEIVPPPLDPWEKRPADEFDLDEFDLDDTILYPSEE